MKTKLAAAATAIAITLSATQAYARCDDQFSAYGPGTDESVELAACFADKAKTLIDVNPNFVSESNLSRAFVICAAQSVGEEPALVQEMSEAELTQFLNEHFHMWTFENEMACHVGKLHQDPNYDPLSALPN